MIIDNYVDSISTAHNPQYIKMPEVKKYKPPKFKIFFGACGSNYTTADEKANAWLAENQKVRIIDMEYSQLEYGEHSICILYEEV